MNDRLIPPVYEIRDEIVIKADASKTDDAIQKVIEALKQIYVPYHDSYTIKEPYFYGLIMVNTKTGEVRNIDGQWLNHPEVIEAVAESTGIEITTKSGKSFQELAREKNRKVDEYRSILKAHTEAIEHIDAFSFSAYDKAKYEIIKTQCMLTQTIRLTQIMESLSEIASALNKMQDHREE